MKILSNYTFHYQKRRYVWFFGYSSIWKKLHMIPEQWTQVLNKNAGINVALVQFRKSLAAFPTIRDWEVVRNFAFLICSANRCSISIRTRKDNVDAGPHKNRSTVRNRVPHLGFWCYCYAWYWRISVLIRLSSNSCKAIVFICGMKT